MKTKLQMKQRLFPMETYGAHGKVRVIGIMFNKLKMLQS